MQNYQSHKIVEAGLITDFYEDESLAGSDVAWVAKIDGQPHIEAITDDTAHRILKMAADAGTTVNGGWLMRYPDGYVSWSPAKPFEEGYDLVQPSSGKSNIKGYRELNETELANMNAVKTHGKVIGDLVAVMRDNPDHDQRWVSIGATDLQKGFMFLTRAIAKPEFF